MIVQRLFAAKSFSHAQGGVIFTAYIKILPFFTLVLPGMISRVLSPGKEKSLITYMTGMYPNQ